VTLHFPAEGDRVLGLQWFALLAIPADLAGHEHATKYIVTGRADTMIYCHAGLRKRQVGVIMVLLKLCYQLVKTEN
jgi:hypothetical protein